jgi:hypothetical protein
MFWVSNGRRLTRADGRGLEILGHAIEYLADEYAVDPSDKGQFGNSDPRVHAIQILKRLNRAVYFSGKKERSSKQASNPLRRLGRWFLGERPT